MFCLDDWGLGLLFPRLRHYLRCFPHHFTCLQVCSMQLLSMLVVLTVLLLLLLLTRVPKRSLEQCNRPVSVMSGPLSPRCTCRVCPVTDPDGQKCQFELVLMLSSQMATNYNRVWDFRSASCVQRVLIVAFYSDKNSSRSGRWGMHPPSPLDPPLLVFIRHKIGSHCQPVRNSISRIT